jgi:hypothetical protein
MRPINWDLLAIAGIALLLMYRLERLGRQLEATSFLIREELQTHEDGKDEILREWKESDRSTPTGQFCS